MNSFDKKQRFDSHRFRTKEPSATNGSKDPASFKSYERPHRNFNSNKRNQNYHNNQKKENYDRSNTCQEKGSVKNEPVFVDLRPNFKEKFPTKWHLCREFLEASKCANYWNANGQYDWGYSWDVYAKTLMPPVDFEKMKECKAPYVPTNKEEKMMKKTKPEKLAFQYKRGSCFQGVRF